MSLRLASRQKSPVDGFRFKQRETGWESWTSNPQTLWDFNGLVQAVRQHRLANPRFKLNTDIEYIREELDRVNAERMSKIVGAESYYTQSGPMPFPQPLHSLTKSAGDVVAAVKAVNAGRKLISEWREQGFEVVDKSEANRRAEICTGCPKNGQGNFTKWFTIPASEQIKKEIEEIHAEGLATDFDDKINICEACFCSLRVKAWTPMPLILKHLLPEARAALWEHCWITIDK